MDRKTCTAILDETAPGWKAADSPAQYVKTIDPKHRLEAARAVAYLAQHPAKSTPKKKPAAG